MMNEIYHELTFLIKAFLLGILISFIYDQLRVLRRCIRHNFFLTSIEDIIFWIWVTAEIFSLQMAENNGSFRMFSVVSTSIGMLIYRFLIKNNYVRFMSVILERVLKWSSDILNFILTPYFYIENSCSLTLKRLRKKMHIKKRIRKIRLTSMLKMLKITLCKQRKGRSDENGRTKNPGSKEKSKSI